MGSVLPNRLHVGDDEVALVGGHNPQNNLQYIYVFSSELPSDLSSQISVSSSEARYLVIHKYEAKSLESYDASQYMNVLILVHDEKRSYLWMMDDSMDAPVSLNVKDKEIAQVVLGRLSKLDAVMSSLLNKYEDGIAKLAAQKKNVLQSLRNF